jgi:uncharacterized protein (DUF58 family)
VLTLLIGFAAVNTGNNLLYLLVSALLGFMAVSGVLGKWNLSGISVNCHPPAEVYDGLTTLMKVELFNRRRWLPGILLEVGYYGQKALFPIVDAKSSQQRLVEITFEGRGQHPAPTLRLSSRFPINFFIRHKTLETEKFITVFPRPQLCPMDQLQDPNIQFGNSLSLRKGQDGDINRISNYRGGEPLKRIHWKLSARQGQLKVKELSTTAHTPLILEINQLPGANLEQKLQHGAYLVTRMLRSGRPVGLQNGTMVIPPDTGLHHKQRLLHTLALYGQD